jgi:hypothetical protein
MADFRQQTARYPIGKGLCMQPHVFQWPVVAIAAVKVNIALLAGVTS